MRVLVYGLSPDKYGGIETFLLNLNRHLSNNIEFLYVVEGQETIHEREINSLGGAVRFIAEKRALLSNFRDWLSLLREERELCDIVYFNLFSLSWFLPIMLSKMMGYRVVVHAHNNALHKGGLLLALHELGKLLLHKMDVVRLTNSDLSNEFFFGKDQALLLRNSIDTKRFGFDEGVRNGLRAALGVEGRKVYLFVGRLAYQKNPGFLLDVFKEIRNKEKTSAFVVVGDGELRSVLQAYSDENQLDVRFVGIQEKVEDYYRMADLLVLPSRYEGFGLSLIEAQCSGLPCITSKDVVPSIVQVTSLLEYKSLDEGPEEWAKTCIQLAKSKGVEDRMRYQRIIKEKGFDIASECVMLEKMFMRIGGAE